MTYIESLNEDEKFALLFGIMAGDGCLSLVNGSVVSAIKVTSMF